jgi:hypothetical protein
MGFSRGNNFAKRTMGYRSFAISLSDGKNLTPSLGQLGYCYSLLVQALFIILVIEQFSKLERRRRARLPGLEGEQNAPYLPGYDLTLLKIM